MDPWRPKYKRLYDTIENIIGAAKVAAVFAVLFLIVIAKI